MSPVAGLRYNYMTRAWDSPLSWGVQSLIEFNGYTINDRYQSDRIRIYSIVGLDGPDITDVRESIPGDEGENAYQGLNRGRTFVMTGAIESNNLASTTRMRRDLLAAYSPLVEAPMKFRWFDVFDGFDDSQTLLNYVFLYGSGAASSLVINGGILNWATTTPALIMRNADARMWSDVQVTLRCIAGGPSNTSSVSTDSTAVSIVLAATDANDYLAVTYTNSSSPTLQIVTYDAGAEHVITTINLPLTLSKGQPFWLRGKKEGDQITAEIWLTKPVDTALPTFFVQGVLSGSDSDNYGDKMLSLVGFGAAATNNYWSFDDFTVDSLYPGDVAFDAKMITKASISDAQQQKTIFRRPIQLTMRTSWPYARGAHQRRSQTLIPASGNTTQFGFSNPLTNPLQSQVIIPGSISIENNILSINNRGTGPERPILVFYGAVTNFAIYNLINGMEISWSGQLLDGDYLVFDCQNRTLVSSSGANQQQYLSISDSRWMILEPGWNDLYVVGNSYSANTKFLAFMHDRWF